MRHFGFGTTPPRPHHPALGLWVPSDPSLLFLHTPNRLGGEKWTEYELFLQNLL